MLILWYQLRPWTPCKRRISIVHVCRAFLIARLLAGLPWHVILTHKRRLSDWRRSSGSSISDSYLQEGSSISNHVLGRLASYKSNTGKRSGQNMENLYSDGTAISWSAVLGLVFLWRSQCLKSNATLLDHAQGLALQKNILSRSNKRKKQSHEE